jgi:hypothetical protein
MEFAPARQQPIHKQNAVLQLYDATTYHLDLPSLRKTTLWTLRR